MFVNVIGVTLGNTHSYAPNTVEKKGGRNSSSMCVLTLKLILKKIT